MAFRRVHAALRQHDSRLLRKLAGRRSAKKNLSMYWAKDGLVHIHKHIDNLDALDCEYVDMRHVPVDDCDCDLYCELLAPEFSPHNNFVARRYVCGRRRGADEMIADIGFQITSRWRLEDDGSLVENDNVSLFMSALQATEGMHFCNSYTIPSYRHDCPTQSNSHLLDGWDPIVCSHLIEAYRQWDLEFFKLMVPGMRITRDECRRSVWHEVKFGAQFATGTPYNMTTVNGEIPSLKILALRKCSPFNQVFGRNKRGPNSIYSMTDLFPTKHLKEVSKHNHPTHTTNRYLRGIAGMIPGALEIMYDVTGWSALKATEIFEWTENLVHDAAPPLKTAYGYRPGLPGTNKVTVKVSPTHHVEYSVDGPKARNIDYAKHEAIKCFEQAAEGKVEIPEIYYTNARKPEVFNSRNDRENEKFNLKNRIFTIPSCVLLLCSMIVNGFRQKVERGDHIAIGHNWFWGGAERIARLLNYDRAGQVIELADFWRYDKTILAHLLLLYSSFASYYYADKGDIEILLNMVDAVASALAIKPITFIGNVCKLMMGVMPSGAYETSHGDSWINLFLFCVFFTYSTIRHPHMAADMKRDFKNKVIMYIVYGDDNLSSYPRKYKHILGIQERRKFFLKFFDMKLRDCETHDFHDGLPGIFTRVDRVTGKVLHQGPMFLQNSFVHKSDVWNVPSGACEVLPYRSHWKTMTKFAFGSGEPRVAIDFVAASIGHAYDTKGTNPIAYRFCRFMYEYWLSRTGSAWESVRRQILQQTYSRATTKLFKKCGMPPEIIGQGFPTRAKLLSMHVWDPDTFNNGAYKACYNMRHAGKHPSQDRKSVV